MTDDNSLTPRKTALRMITHLQDEVSYEDIIRQLRILQHIDWTMRDLELAGSPADEAVEEARSELRGPSNAGASVVLRSRPLFDWRSLADRSDDDVLFRKASWIY